MRRRSGRGSRPSAVPGAKNSRHDLGDLVGVIASIERQHLVERPVRLAVQLDAAARYIRDETLSSDSVICPFSWLLPAASSSSGSPSADHARSSSRIRVERRAGRLRRRRRRRRRACPVARGTTGTCTPSRRAPAPRARAGTAASSCRRRAACSTQRQRHSAADRRAAPVGCPSTMCVCATVALDVARGSAAARTGVGDDRRLRLAAAARRPSPCARSISSSSSCSTLPAAATTMCSRVIRARVQRAQVVHAHRADRLARAEDRVAVRMLRPTAPRCAARRRDRPACPPPSRSPRAPPSARASRSLSRSSGRKTRSPMTSAACGRCSSSTRAWIRRVLARRVRVERAAQRLERRARSRARCGARVPLNTMCSRRCDTPIRSRVSCSDAARTQAPNATDRTPGMCSESTVSPLGRVGAAKRATCHSRERYQRCGDQPVRRDDRSRPPRPPRPPRHGGRPPRGRRVATRRSPLLADRRPHAAGSPSPSARHARGSAMPSGLRHQRLHRQAQASALVAIDELHLHAVALLDHVLGLLGAAVPHLGDVQRGLRCPA